MKECCICGAVHPKTKIARFNNRSKRKLCIVCLECNLPAETVPESVASALEHSGIAIEEVSGDYLRFRKSLRTMYRKKAKSTFVDVKRPSRDKWNAWYKTKYINSKEWKTISEYVRARDLDTCQECGIHEDSSPFYMEVHHNTYYHLNRFGYTLPEDCVLLCPECHDLRQMSTDREFDCVRYSYFHELRHEKTPKMSTKEELLKEICRLKKSTKEIISLLQKKAEEAE